MEWFAGYTGWGKSRFTVVSMWNAKFTLVLLFFNYRIIFHTNNCKPTFAYPVLLSEERKANFKRVYKVCYFCVKKSLEIKTHKCICLFLQKEIEEE